MKILLSSTDNRSLDHAVRTILDAADHAKAPAVGLPLPTLVNRAPNGSVVSGVSRRIIGISTASGDLLVAFGKMILPTSVNISITA